MASLIVFTKHPVYTWYIEAGLPEEREAHIQVLIESETDAGEEGGFYSVVNCFASISLGMMGSDHVRWDAPRINVLLDDSQAFEEKFHAMEQVNGAAGRDRDQSTTSHNAEPLRAKSGDQIGRI